MSHVETVKKELPVKLAPEDVAARAQSLANRIEGVAKLKLEAAETAKGYKDRIKDEETAIAELANVVAHKREKRAVLCTINYDTRRHSVDTVRTDTGEIVDSRAMTAEEIEDANQGKLFGDRDDREAPPDRESKSDTDADSNGEGEDASVDRAADDGADRDDDVGEPAPGTEIIPTPDLLEAAERAAERSDGDG